MAVPIGRTGAAVAALAGAVGVTLNVFARRAPWRVYPWYLPGVGLGLGGTELAVPMAAVQTAAAGLAVGLGAGRSRLGVAGLVATAGTAAGLLDLHRSGLAAGRVLDRALFDAVGPVDEAAAPAGRAHPLITRDVRYHHEAPEQLLDIWRRPDLAGGAPVLIQVHGGSWTAGTKATQGLFLMRQLTAHGWVCVSVDYRLGPRNRWPAQIVDVKRAIAWVRAHISEYGGDPSFLAITGGSAGGHLAALAAVSGNDPAFQPGFESVDTGIQAAAPLYGVYDLTAYNDDGQPRLRRYVRKVLFDADPDDDPDTWRAASPTLRIDHTAPPMLVVHGDRDEIVSVNQARAFARRAVAVSRQPFGYAELPYAHHAFDVFGSARTTATVRTIRRFLDSVRHNRNQRR